MCSVLNYENINIFGVYIVVLKIYTCHWYHTKNYTYLQTLLNNPFSEIGSNLRLYIVLNCFVSFKVIFGSGYFVLVWFLSLQSW